METVRNGFAAIGAAAVASSVAIFLWHAYDRVSGADTAEDTASSAWSRLCWQGLQQAYGVVHVCLQETTTETHPHWCASLMTVL